MIAIIKVSNWIYPGHPLLLGIAPCQVMSSPYFFATDIDCSTTNGVPKTLQGNSARLIKIIWYVSQESMIKQRCLQPTNLQRFMIHMPKSSIAACHSNAAELATSRTIRQHGNNDFTISTQQNAAEDPLVSPSCVELMAEMRKWRPWWFNTAAQLWRVRLNHQFEQRQIHDGLFVLHVRI